MTYLVELTEEDELWIPKLRARRKVVKHADHDQSTHGNWARGIKTVPTANLKAQQSLKETLEGRTYAERKALTDSIREHGVKEPILVDDDYIVQDGHQRLKIAQSLGIDEVPVTFMGGGDVDLAGIEQKWMDKGRPVSYVSLKDYDFNVGSNSRYPPRTILLSGTVESFWRGSGFAAPHEAFDMPGVADPGIEMSKHYGPGLHPGTQSPQSVHGSGGGVAVANHPVDPKRPPGEGGTPGTQEKLVDIPRADMETLLGFTEEGEYGDMVRPGGDSMTFYDLQQRTKGDWVQWQGARDIRQAAAEIAGVDESETFETVDPHVDMEATHSWYSGTDDPMLEARYLMESIIDSETYPDLYRAIGMLDPGEMDEFLALARPGTVFDAPLLSFSNHAVIGENNILERFGTDILLHVEGPTTGLYTGAMEAPMWTQRDEDQWLNDFRITALDSIDEAETPELYEEVDYLRDAVDSHLSGKTKLGDWERNEISKLFVDENGFRDTNTRWAGAAVPESSDVYYDISDEADYGTDSGQPGEVISGGRFRVVSAEPGSGDFDTWDHVITVKQIGVFDPFNEKTLIEKMVKAAFVLDGGPLTNPEWAAKRRKRKKVGKHYGPGPHPSGSPQSVHGGGTGGGTKVKYDPPETAPKTVGEDDADQGAAKPVSERIRRWDGKLAEKLKDNGWDQHASDVRDKTDAGIHTVWANMKADERWGEAREQWDTLDIGAAQAMDVIFDEGEKLVDNMWQATASMGLDFPDYDPDPWTLEEHFNNHVMVQGADVEEYGFDWITSDDLTNMMETNEVVNTSWETTATHTIGVDLHPNARWRVVSIDTETGQVQLERLSVRTSEAFGGKDGLGDHWTLGPLLSGEGRSLGPEIVTVPVDSLFKPTEDDIQMVVMSEDSYNGLSSIIADLTSDYSDFETDYGVNPHDAIAHIEVGNFDIFSGAGVPASTGALIVNDSYGGTGTTIVEMPEDVPKALRNLWANTAADEHRWALALQMATRDEFGLDSLPISSLIGRADVAIVDAKETYESFDVGLRVYSRAVYDMTQEHIADNDYLDGGGDGTWPLMRGMGLSQDVVDTHYGEMRLSGLGMGASGGTAYTRIWEPAEITLNPMSSFTSDFHIANSFGSPRATAYSSLTRAYVPTDQIWGISILGNGSYKESEVIVLGGDDAIVGEMSIAKQR